jgi:hypothetical protein
MGYVATLIGESLELIQEVASNSEDMGSVPAEGSLLRAG